MVDETERTSVVTRDQAAEKNPLLEKLGKDKLKWIASFGLFAATALGVSGKPNVGGGAGVETYNPITGEQVGIGVALATRDEAMGGGIPQDFVDRMGRGTESYRVKVGSASVIVHVGSMKPEQLLNTKNILTVYAGVETKGQIDQRVSETLAKEAQAKK